MRRALSIVLLGAVVAGGARARADMPMVVPIVVPSPQHVSAGDQYYSFTLPGLRQYLTKIRAEQPALYSRVDPALAELEGRARQASWLGWGGLGLGVGMLIGGVALVGVSDTTDTAAVVLLAGSVPVMLGGFIGWAVTVPKRDDLLEVVNLHNGAAPATPLRLSAGLLPRVRGLQLTMARF